MNDFELPLVRFYTLQHLWPYWFVLTVRHPVVWHRLCSAAAAAASTAVVGIC